MIFPIGTSRIHEPLSLIKECVLFPNVGYFHSSSQVLNWLEILVGRKALDVNNVGFFFRKDQTPDNPFDPLVWGSQFHETIKRAKAKFDDSDYVLIELSSEKSWLLNDIAVQGNPNKYHNLSYSEIWKADYYSSYHPELNVKILNGYDCLQTNIKKIAAILSEKNKKVIFMGHIYNPEEPNKTRLNHNKKIKSYVEGLSMDHVVFYDQNYLVKNFGFRVLKDNVIDIHHLPWEALNVQAKDFLSLTYGECNFYDDSYSCNELLKQIDVLIKKKNYTLAKKRVVDLKSRFNNREVLEKCVEVYFESYSLINTLSTLDEYLSKFEVTNYIDRTVKFLSDELMLNKTILEDLGLHFLKEKFDQKETCPIYDSAYIKSKINSIENDDHEGRAKVFLKSYNWLMPQEKDADLFAQLFISSRFYQPYIYNLINLHAYEYTQDLSFTSYITCLFRLGRYNDIIVDMSSHEESTNKQFFFYDLAMQGVGVKNANIKHYDKLVKPKDEESDFHNLFCIKSAIINNSNLIDSEYWNLPIRVKQQLLDSDKRTNNQNVTRVAVCFSGQLRHSEDNINKWIDYFNKSDFLCDFFISTWDADPAPKINSSNLTRSFSKSAAQSISALKKEQKLRLYDELFQDREVGKSILDKIFADGCFHIEKEMEFEKYILNTFGNDILRTELNQLKMFYQIHKCFELARCHQEKNNFEYDVYIRIRPDLNFSPLESTEILDVYNKKSIGVYYAQVDGIDDKFAICSKVAMSAYSAIWTMFDSCGGLKILPTHKVFLAESLLLRIMFSFDIDINLLRKSRYAGLANHKVSDERFYAVLEKNICAN